MLPVLVEMERLGLLTPCEANEINAYATSSVADWLTLPQPLAVKANQAMQLLKFDPDEEPWVTMH